MELFFSLINNHNVPWFLAGFIILLGLVVWISFRINLYYVLRDLQQARTAIQAISKRDFINHYETLNETLSQNKLLSHHWLAFQQTLLLPKQAGQPIYYTIRPNFYFNETSLIAARINLTLYQAVPNILVGIGLFFTFIGLVAALWFASEGVAAPDIEKAQQALRDLLHAATFKFVTSIAGLLASLVFSWREKAQLHRLQEKLNDFCHLLESRLEFNSLEQINNRQLAEAERQTQQLARFNSELAVSIASALEDKFSEKLIEAMHPMTSKIDSMVGSIENLVEKVGDVNQSALERMMESFTEHLQGAAGAEMQQLGETLQQLVPVLNEFQQKFDSSSSNFGSKMEDASSVLQQGFQEATDTLLARMSEANQEIQANTSAELQKITEPLAHVVNALESLKVGLDESTATIKGRLTAAAQESAKSLMVAGEQLAKPLTETGENLATVKTELTSLFDESQELFRDMVKQLQMIHKNLQLTHENLEIATPPLAQTADSLSQTVNQVEILVETVKTTGEKLTNTTTSTAEALLETNKTVEQVWGKYKDRFEKVDEDVAKTFQELSNGLGNYRQQVESFTQKLDESLTNAVKSLSSVIVELVEAIEDMQGQNQKK